MRRCDDGPDRVMKRSAGDKARGTAISRQRLIAKHTPLRFVDRTGAVVAAPLHSHTLPLLDTNAVRNLRPHPFQFPCSPSSTITSRSFLTRWRPRSASLRMSYNRNAVMTRQQHQQKYREVAKLPAIHPDADGAARESPVYNKLAEQDKSPLNETYTIDRQPGKRVMVAQERTSGIPRLNSKFKGRAPMVRSASVDSFTKPNDANDPRASVSVPTTRDYNHTMKKSNSGNLIRPWSNKLPFIDPSGNSKYVASQTKSQAHFDLHKYKETLKK